MASKIGNIVFDEDDVHLLDYLDYREPNSRTQRKDRQHDRNV